MRGIKIRLALAATGVAALATFGATASASASVHPHSTFGCQTYDASYCGSQQQNNNDWVWAVQNDNASAGAKIISQHYSTGREDQDFDMRNVSGLHGSGGPDKQFRFAPDGVRTNLCIAATSIKVDGGLTLQACHNNANQEFSPKYVDGTYVAWRSLGNSNLVIQNNPHWDTTGGQLELGNYVGDDFQQFEFVN